MKKLFLTLGTTGLFALSSHAAVILNEPFSYPDGSLTGPGNISSDAWVTHSGTTGQVDVVSGVVNLSQSETEDISSALPGGPFTTGNLYASLKINLSTLPGGNGTYYFHFRDTGTINFRARTFLTSTNAAPGSYRVGITAGGNSPAVIPVDLSLGTEYKLVVRYHTEAATATLWINPTSEGAVTSRADSTDTPSVVPVHLVCLRQSGPANGMGVLTVDDLLVGSAFADVQTIGGRPSISGLVNVNIPANSNTGPLPFTVSDVETPAGDLTLSASSDNPVLVPNSPANLAFGGAGANRTLTVTPATGQQGTANLKVVVTDGNSETATNTFTILVGRPSIGSVPNQVAPVNSVLGPVVFTVADNETAPGSLAVTATSSDAAVLPDSNIGIVNNGGTRSLFLTNIAAGFANVTVTVNDGTFDVSTAFTLTAYPTLGWLMDDNFSYADGSITTNSGFLWATHSASTGQTGQTQVLNGKLLLANNASEDINRWFTNAPIVNTSGTLLHSRFVVKFSALPTASGVGEYFGHFREATGGNFRARLFSTTSGVTSGKLKLALSNGGFLTAVHPTELSLDTDYVVITRFNTATAQCTLWVSPASEASISVTPVDSATPITTYGYAFRQQSGIGSLSVDDLVIGSTFDEVFISILPPVPPPIPLGFQLSGSNLELSWSDSLFVLQAAPTVTGTYTNIPGATSPYLVPTSGDQRYFRLAYPLP